MAHRNPRDRSDLSFLEIVSHGCNAPSDRHGRVLPGQIEQIARTVRHTPEVMVKISGGGHNTKAVAAHFRYIGRQEFEIETDDGDHLKGKGAAKALIDDWELELDAAESRSAYRGKSGRKPAKLVHNIVLSMPAGAPAAGVLEASRAFAREQFALKHRYALALHTDEAHPHVHLVVKAMSEQGGRMNIRKQTLREWRRQFASHLRAQGIAANATERAARGVTRTQKDLLPLTFRTLETRHLLAGVVEQLIYLTRQHPHTNIDDFYEATSNDVSSQKYIRVQRPRVQVVGRTVALPDTRCGFIRLGGEGSVFHRTSGEHECGYAVCLA